MLLRKELWNRGLRYQECKNHNGKPDIVFKGKKLLFVTVNFGMDMIGITEKMILKATVIFGSQRLKEICKEM